MTFRIGIGETLVFGGALGAKRVVWLVAAWLVSCSAPAGGPPEIVLDRTVCAHCGMLVSEPAYAAAYRVPGEDHKVFDDIACLLSGLERESAAPEEVWFHDLETGAWMVDGASPVFVVGGSFETPMGGGIVAYSDDTAAERAISDRGGRRIASFDVLRRGERATR